MNAQETTLISTVLSYYTEFYFAILINNIIFTTKTREHFRYKIIKYDEDDQED